VNAVQAVEEGVNEVDVPSRLALTRLHDESGGTLHGVHKSLDLLFGKAKHGRIHSIIEVVERGDASLGKMRRNDEAWASELSSRGLCVEPQQPKTLG
jgi:hypothetical protein